MLKTDFYKAHMEIDVFMDALLFFEGLNDFSIPIEEVCSIKLHTDSYSRCIAIRDFHSTNDYYLMVSEVYVDAAMNNVVIVITYDNSGVIVEENIFHVYYMMNDAGENPLHIESVATGNNPLYE